MHKYTGRLALQMRKYTRKCRCRFNRHLAAISGSSSCLPAKINRCLGGKTPMVSSVDGRICRYEVLVPSIWSGGMPSLSWIFASIFLGPTHCRISIFATSLFCWSWWNSGIRGADHPQVLGISGPVPAYPYDDLHLHVEIKPKVQVFSKDTANSKDQNSTQFKCVRAFTLSMVSEAFSKARM